MGDDVLCELDLAIRTSLDHARAHPAEALATARKHAVELEESVLRAHIDLYVNAWTRDLGVEGETALRELARRAHAAEFGTSQSFRIRQASGAGG